MNIYKLLSGLLAYPENNVNALEQYNNGSVPENAANGKLGEFCRWYGECDLQKLQEEYVATFDINKTISLNLFEYVYGNSPQRGPAMVDLIGIYMTAGLTLTDEMPDYLPVLLEFIAETGTEHIAPLMPTFIDSLQTLTSRLEESGSKYAILTGTVASLLANDFTVRAEPAGGV